MLQSLHVHNFALLDDAEANFTEGFNVFTGETGAGKSILIDAFSVALGGRASTDYIRHGCDSFWVQAVFEIEEDAALKEILAEQDLEPEDNMLFLKRQLAANGKGKAYINNVQVPISFLKKLGGHLVDIHGQHENQALLNEDAPRLLTDLLGGTQVEEALRVYQDLYKEYVTEGRKLQQLRAEAGQQDLLLDRYAWEIKEISDAKLIPNEEEQLEQEAKVLANREKIISSVDKGYALLDSENGILSRVAQVKEELRYAARFDDKLRSHLDSVDSVLITLDDVRNELGDYLSRSDFNAEYADSVQQRLDTIYRLQKKYGGTTEDVLAYLEATREKYEQLLNVAEAISKAEAKVKAMAAKLHRAGDLLTAARQQSAAVLSQAVTEHIRDLAMPDGIFKIAIVSAGRFLPTGIDVLTFQFSANAGEPEQALEKVASGGELSRIALAIKTVMIKLLSVPTMVFDEIDTGVGGVTAQKMAEKIAAIAAVGQVLCITHLPQIAAFADNHIYIVKGTEEGRTSTKLVILEPEKRVEELRRMTVGDLHSEASLRNAQELLDSANTYKNKLR